MASLSLRKSANNSNGNGLILFHYPNSFYSQKVVLALLEKKLKYKQVIVDLTSFQHFEPSFVRINPACEVPVLRDGIKIIPDSSRILDYLEDNFSNGDTPRLLPDRGSDTFHKVKILQDMLNGFPAEAISYGCYVYPEETHDMKVPSMIRNRAKAVSAKRPQKLLELAEKYPDLKEIYLQKKSRVDLIDGQKQDRTIFHQHLNAVEVILDKVENELASHQPGQEHWWLCCDIFTVADISLAVILNRLSLLGLSKRYWGDGKRQHLAAYFNRLSQKETFKKACVHGINIMKIILTIVQQNAPYFLGTVALLAAIGVGLFLIVKKKH